VVRLEIFCFKSRYGIFVSWEAGGLHGSTTELMLWKCKFLHWYIVLTVRQFCRAESDLNYLLHAEYSGDWKEFGIP
jgi:hypothetical protein